MVKWNKEKAEFKRGGSGERGWHFEPQDVEDLQAMVKEAQQTNGEYPWITVEQLARDVNWGRDPKTEGSAAWTVNRRLKGADPRTKFPAGKSPIPIKAFDRELADGTKALVFMPYNWKDHGKRAEGSPTPSPKAPKAPKPE